MRAGLKKDWSLHQRAFEQLLRWLDEGVDSGGEKYLEIRRRLIFYFTRKNCISPEDLADETLNRVARRLEEEGTASDTQPARYCYIVAKFVFLEHQRSGGRAHVSIGEMLQAGELSAPSHPESADTRARLLACLDECLLKLKPENRDLIFDYYRGERREKIEARREMASRFGLTMNALTIRACRIRDQLEACVRACSAEK